MPSSCAAACARPDVYKRQLEIVPEVLCGGVRVSSTRIRELLAAGDVKEAGRLLGRAFGYRLTVVHGKRLGRTLDSPTINQRFPKSFGRRRHGVYAAAAVVDGALLPAVANIGPVSYTHLDVYKRQDPAGRGRARFCRRAFVV